MLFALRLECTARIGVAGKIVKYKNGFDLPQSRGSTWPQWCCIAGPAVLADNKLRLKNELLIPGQLLDHDTRRASCGGDTPCCLAVSQVHTVIIEDGRGLGMRRF